jgi:uncharacterized protein (TIGR03067 family)
MRVVLLALTVALLASAHLLGVAVRPMKKDPVKEDMKKLEGEWVIESYIQGGQDFSATFGAGKMTRTISGNRWTTTSNGQVTPYTFRIDPGKKPKTIDITMGGEGKQQTFLCIYEVEGDTLKLCQAQAGQNRPAKFEAANGNDILTVAKRKKAK